MPSRWSQRGRDQLRGACGAVFPTRQRPRSLIGRRTLFLGCPRLGRGGRDPRYGSKCRDFRDWTQQDLLPSRLSSVLPEVQPDSGNVRVTRWSSPREALCADPTSQVPHLLGRTTFFSHYGPFASTAIGLKGRLCPFPEFQGHLRDSDGFSGRGRPHCCNRCFTVDRCPPWIRSEYNQPRARPKSRTPCVVAGCQVSPASV